MADLGGVTLPRSTVWVDEFEWGNAGHSVSYTQGGRLVLEPSERRKGRSITLDLGWVDRATLSQLAALRDQPGGEFALSLPAGGFTVAFRHQDAPVIQAVPVRPVANPEPGEFYECTIKLMEI